MRPVLRRGKSVWGWGGREGDETSSLQSRTHLQGHRRGSWSSSATRELCSEGTRPGSMPRSAAALRPARATMDFGGNKQTHLPGAAFGAVLARCMHSTRALHAPVVAGYSRLLERLNSRARETYFSVISGKVYKEFQIYLSLRQEETSSFHLFNIKELFWYDFHVPVLAGCTFRKLPAWLLSLLLCRFCSSCQERCSWFLVTKPALSDGLIGRLQEGSKREISQIL